MTFIFFLFDAIAFFSIMADSPPGNEAEESFMGNMASCEESWLDWKDDDVRMREYFDRFDADFTPVEWEAEFFAKKNQGIGLPLINIYPESVGTGVGSSLHFWNVRNDPKRSATQARHATGKLC